MFPTMTRLWIPCWGDMELYEIAHSYVDNETICDNECGLHNHSLPCLLLPYKLKVN